MSRMQRKYINEVVPALKERFGYGNVMEIPRLEKIVINMGVGEATGDAKAIDAAVNDMTVIAGQKPVVTQGQKVHRSVQGTGRYADRGQGNLAWRTDV